MPSVPSQPDLGPKRVDQKPGSQVLQSPAGARGVFRKPGIDAPNAGFPKVTVKAGEMPSQQVRPPQVDVVSAQRQQGERRVPFEDRFTAGVGASFDGQRWVSTGMKDDIGRLIFRPEGGGDLKAIDAYMLQVKGAFPLEPETQASASRRNEDRQPQVQAPRTQESLRGVQAYPFTKYEFVLHRGKRFIVRDGLDPKHIALMQHLPERPDDALIIEHTTREELMKEGNNPIPLNVRMETVNTPKAFDAAMASFAGVQGRNEFMQSAQQRKAAEEFFRTGEGDDLLTREAGIRDAAHRIRGLMFRTR